MFRKGGSANEGIMHGLERKGYDNGGKIEPFNRYTADTFGSPYYDNEVIMENLRRFQKLGMGNPYRELGGKAGFDSIGDYIFRPAEKDLFKSIHDAAPIVKKEKAAKEAMEKVIETAEKMASTVDHISSFDRNEMCKLISEVQGEGGSEKDMIEAIHGFSGEVLTPAQLRLLGLGTTI